VVNRNPLQNFNLPAPAPAPAPAPNGDSQRKEDLNTELERVGDWLRTAADNGMYNHLATKQNIQYDSFENIGENLNRARQNLTDGTTPALDECEHQITIASGKFSNALYNTDTSWRFNNIYAGWIWIYLISFLILDLTFFVAIVSEPSRLDAVFGKNSSQYLIGIYSTMWGIVGGILRALWYLRRLVDDRKYRNSFLQFNLSAPFFGGIFGSFSYFIMLAGLLVVNGTAQGEIKNIFLMICVSSILGFSWPNMVQLIKNLADSISTKPDTSA